MDLNYTPEDIAFRKQVRTWLEQNLPREPIRTLGERAPWHRKLYEGGYLGMGWPKEYGGGGARPMEQAIVADEMARANAPAPTNGLGLGIVGPTIVVHGTDAQKRRYLRKILTAEELWCQLYSEPNAGSDLAALKTSAADKGDHFVVNGQKIWTSGGPIADWGLLLARTDPAVAKHKGISCFLMNMRQPGVDVRPLKQITGSSEFSEVFMTNARVEKADQIGRLGEGWAIAQTTLGYERGGRSLARVTSYAAQYRSLVNAARRLTPPRPPADRRSPRASEARPHLGRARGGALRRACACSPSSSAASIRVPAARSPSSHTRSSRSASWSSPRRSSVPTASSPRAPRRSISSRSTPPSASTARGPTPSSGHAPAPSTPAPPRSRRT